MVDELQQGGHCSVLDVVVSGQAAQYHQGPQPHRQAVHIHPTYGKQNRIITSVGVESVILMRYTLCQIR